MLETRGVMMAARMQMRVYQAQLTLPASLARVQAATPAVERIGGKVEIATTSAGVIVVRLHIPEPQRPEHYVPGLPFYPV